MILFSLGLYRRLSAQLALVRDNLDRLTRGLFVAYLVIMVLFLLGYTVVISTYLFNLKFQATAAYRLFCEAVFLLGSVFAAVGTAADIRLTGAIHRVNLALIRVLINTVEARDINLNGHSRHVAAIVMLLYRKLPAASRKRLNPHLVEYAALLHDIGKMGISEDILDKPGPLTDAEFELMRAHPAIGSNILANVPGFQEAREWVCYHHERVDGKGYYSLPGDEIPLVSKLIAVADTYSAIVMCRSYKARRTHEEAMRIMRDCAGSQLDKGVLELFEQCAPQILALRPMIDAMHCEPPPQDCIPDGCAVTQ